MPAARSQGLQVPLPIAVEAAGGEEGEVERCGAHAPDAGGGRHHAAQLAQESRMLGTAAMRNAGGDHAIGELGPGRDPDAPVVEIGALAALGGKGLVVGRAVDQTRHQLAVALERDRDGEMRDAVQEIGGAVERIDDEAVGAVGALDLAALLEQEAVAGPRAGKLAMQDLLGAGVGGGDEIGGTLQRDLKLLDLAEIARQAAARFAGGAEHHIHQG